MRIPMLAPVLLSLAACASQPAPETTVAAASTASAPAAQTCHKETTIGSNIPHTVCNRPESVESRVLDDLHNSETSHSARSKTGS